MYLELVHIYLVSEKQAMRYFQILLQCYFLLILLEVKKYMLDLIKITEVVQYKK